MEFDWQWLLIGLPLAFALGWIGARIDLKQWRRAERDAPRAYFKGLNLLLNEQQDKAIDAFVEAVQHDPDTTELHFALGNLFRRRGEFERAVRVHQHLLQRGDLKREDRDRAQHALAQDFVKAGLFDRAEAAYKALDGTAFASEARLALLALYERSRDWQAALEVATALEAAGTGSFAARIAHFHCELALAAEARGDDTAADAELQRARGAAPLAARPLIEQARRAQQRSRHGEALAAYAELARHDAAAFVRVAADYARAAHAAGEATAARRTIEDMAERQPALELLRALSLLDGQPLAGSPRLQALLKAQPSLGAAMEMLQGPPTSWPEGAADALRDALGRAARPLQRYRCAACGFEAQRYFWQCPGCLNWDSFPPQRVEEL